MSTLRRVRPIYHHSRLRAAAMLACAVCGVAGSASIAQARDVSGFDEITLAPGDTGTCNSIPCTVYLQMPPGEGSYEVWSSGDGRVGEYPSGETVKLGSFWSTQAFTIKGMDVPKAYAYIPNQP
jgi:hypothetical protein